MVREELLDKLILESLEVYLKKEDEKLKNDTEVDEVEVSEQHAKKMKELFDSMKK